MSFCFLLILIFFSYKFLSSQRRLTENDNGAYVIIVDCRIDYFDKLPRLLRHLSPTKGSIANYASLVNRLAP